MTNSHILSPFPSYILKSFSSLGLIHRLRHGYYSSKYLKYKKYVMSVAAVTVGLGGITAVALFRRKRIK